MKLDFRLADTRYDICVTSVGDGGTWSWGAPPAGWWWGRTTCPRRTGWRCRSGNTATELLYICIYSYRMLYNCKYSYRCINRPLTELLFSVEYRYRTNIHIHIQVQNLFTPSPYRYRTYVHLHHTGTELFYARSYWYWTILHLPAWYRTGTCTHG